MILVVYYKVDASVSDTTLPRIKHMQAQLAQSFPSLMARLMKRPEIDAEGRATWMETYELQNLDETLFKSKLDALVAYNDLPVPRKNEYFVNL